MPVVGHAIAGLVFATSLDGAASKVKPAPFGRWAFVLVALAYAPDVVAQLGVTVGFRPAAVISHSLVFAAATAALLAPFVGRVCAVTVSRGFALALISLVLHDGMDMVQSPGRMPLWPLPFEVDLGTWIPATFEGELLSCLPVLIVAIVRRWRRRGWRLPTRVDWASVTAVGIIVCMAATTSELRDLRERDLTEARNLAENGDYEAALEACATAERWPSPAAPGRVDYVRAMSWWGLGRADRAEEMYLRSYEADPDYIWTVADLAVLYASSDVSRAERRRKAELLLIVLQDRFPGDPALPRLVARVRQRLETPK